MSLDRAQEFYDQLDPQDFSYCSYKDELEEEISELKNEIKLLRCQMTKESKDREVFIKRHLETLKKEVYGNAEIDSFKIDASICNIAWVVGQTNDRNRMINVQRKGA
jgi:hypothetical protein